MELSGTVQPGNDLGQRIFGAGMGGSLEWVGGGEAQLEAADVAGGVAAGGRAGVSAAGGDAQV